MAQLVERCVRNAEATSSNLVISTTSEQGFLVLLFCFFKRAKTFQPALPFPQKSFATQNLFADYLRHVTAQSVAYGSRVTRLTAKSGNNRYSVANGRLLLTNLVISTTSEQGFLVLLFCFFKRAKTL